jgi:methyltransferase (TIGR00027 family)
MTKTKRVSQTALRNAVLRAYESCQDKNGRLFDDPFARKFLDFRYRLALNLLLMPKIGSVILAKRERLHPGMIGNFLCRTRFIDDLLKVVLEKSFDQVVILGAGFDTRPYRISGMDKTRVYEVDHPATQRLKIKRVKQIYGKLPSHVTFISIDFDRMTLEDAMARTSFSAEAKTVFIWEGVTQYITAEANDATFRYLSHVAAPESRIIFTYIDRRIIEETTNNKSIANLKAHHNRLGEPWIFGIDPDGISFYLSERRFELIEQVGASEYRSRYLKPLSRQMNIFEGEFTALVKVSTKPSSRLSP